MPGSASEQTFRDTFAAAPHVIETQRLTLRPYALDDAADVQRYAGEWDVARMTTSIPYPYEDGMAEEWIARQAEARQRGDELTWAIERREDGKLAGAVGITGRPDVDAAEMGYWIAMPFWGRGYATEAARAVLACAFTDVGLHRVYARHWTHNPASGRVMQKIGMTYEGTLRHSSRRFDEWKDVSFYSILKSEYHP